MKQICVALLFLFFVSSTVFAADFVPVNKLDISVPDFVQYDFDGSNVDISVEVMGTAGRAYLVVETTGLAGVTPYIRNGRVGWHTVSGIDTTVYTSTGDDLQKGQKYITWSGKDNDGNNVAEGEYTYYVWAFDYVNLIQPAMPMADYDRNNAQARMLLQVTDGDGAVLAKPWISTLGRGRYAGQPIVTDEEIAAETFNCWMRWSLGNDPLNIELVETSSLGLPEGWNARPEAFGRAPYDPADFNNVVCWTSYEEMTTQKLRKFKLVPNGIGEELTDWGEDLTWSYETTDHHTGGFDIVEDTYYCVPIWLYSKSSANSYLLISDLDGNKVEDVYLTEMDKADYVQEHGEVLQAGAPNGGMAFLNDTRMMSGSIWCFQCVYDPVRYVESGNYEDFMIAINEEGDGFIDKGYSVDNPFPDFCYAEDPPWNYGMWGGEDGFVLVGTQSGGPTSWVLFAPDMTGVATCARAGVDEEGETGVMTVNYDCPYDGIYIRPRGWRLPEQRTGYEGLGMAYLGFDSGTGMIAKEPPGTGVATAAPGAFAVAQSSPNPANPTTTISFSIPEAGNVSVDVFNVAGQRVDTLVNNFMDAGSHSVVWDGSSLASGVYFYTVTSGEFSKTMKMTLLN